MLSSAHSIGVPHRYSDFVSSCSVPLGRREGEKEERRREGEGRRERGVGREDEGERRRERGGRGRRERGGGREEGMSSYLEENTLSSYVCQQLGFLRKL